MKDPLFLRGNKKFDLRTAKPFKTVRDNNVDALIPELWSMESLMILVENMVSASLVYRDFEPIIANFGDIVNTRRPGEFTAKRKTTTDNVTIQDAILTNVQVPLNQHIHVSFLIRDGEESKSFKDLVDEFLRPAVIAQARLIDQVVLGQYPQFLNNVYGQLNGMTVANAKQYILGLRQVMNQNKCPMDGRNLIWNSASESVALQLDLFLAAFAVGDDGSALKNATLGRKLAFDNYMDQNMAIVNPGNTLFSDTTTAIVPVGATSLTVVTGGSGVFTPGEWFTLAGDLIPHQILTYTSGTKVITFTPPVQTASISGAGVSGYTSGAVNQSVSPTGYAAGWSKEIAVDAFTVAPQVGQFVTFNTDPTIYTIVQTNALIGITLDRPLVNAIADNDKVNLGPAGNYNFAFHRNAIALVVRPLARPKPGTGALSAVVNWNDLSMRATITYDGNKQGHLVTLDMLAGVAVLDNHLGAVLLA